MLGALSSLWVIVSNHLVQPFVGVTDTRPEFQLAAREVEALVELPLASLHDITRIGWERRIREGAEIDYPYFRLADHQVWGATAMILGEFGALFEPDFGPARNSEFARYMISLPCFLSHRSLSRHAGQTRSTSRQNRRE